MIEFLFQQLKKIILWKVVPIHLAQFYFFGMVTILTEMQ